MDALRSCDPNKAPGYDGFNLKLMTQWDTIGEDVVNFVQSFFPLVSFLHI